MNQRTASVPTRAAELVATYGLAAVVLCLPLEFTTLFFRQQLSRLVLIVVAAAFLYLMLARSTGLDTSTDTASGDSK